MKSLKECIDAALATPANTVGMGGITFPTETTPGSGDIPNAGEKRKKKKKFNRYKKEGT